MGRLGQPPAEEVEFLTDNGRTRMTLLEHINAIERLLVPTDADGTLDTCWLGIRFGGDRGHLVLRILPSVELARHTFQVDGNQFTPPTQHVSGSFRRASDGTITERTWNPPPPRKPPIESNESLPNLGDENHVWGFGVIKLRVGRFLANVNAPSIQEAEMLARRVAELLNREPAATTSGTDMP